MMVACDDMYSMIKDDLDKGETVYTGVVDSIAYYSGNNRVRFTWQVNADPRISKTVIYWNNGNSIDSISVPVNRTQTGVLKMEKEFNIPEGAYTFEFVTKDNDGHRSLAVEISAEIYGERYGASLSNRNISSMVVTKGPEVKLVWANQESVAALYTTLEYTDHSVNPPVKRTIRIENDDTETLLPGIRLEPFTLVTTYHPVGGMDEVNTQVRSYIPYLAEKDILIANGLIDYTSANADGIVKLVYPMHANSFQDLHYFKNVHELDLTGGDIPLPKLSYLRNGVYSEIGGGQWVSYMRKAGDISAANKQIILELLESGQVTKIRYVPNSMGLDSDFAPYILSGVVELTSLPNEALVPNQFNINGTLESTNFTVNLTYPATDAPAGTGLQNVYKMTLVSRCGSIVFAIPPAYQFNLQEYPYLKFRVNTPELELLSGNFEVYRRIWARFMNYLWGFPANIANTAWGQELYQINKGSIIVSEDNLHKWVEYTINLSARTNMHNRVIVITPGEEANTATFPPEIDRTYYFSNIRFSKNP
jgi:hypothetical protein